MYDIAHPWGVHGGPTQNHAETRTGFLRYLPDISMAKQLEPLKNMSVNDLSSALHESREKLRQLHFNLAGGRIRNVREIRATRRKLARILTLLHQYEQ